jgi:hypothetical protein
VCIFGACFDYEGLTCQPALGGECDDDAGHLCCFDRSCIDGACAFVP